MAADELKVRILYLSICGRNLICYLDNVIYIHKGGIGAFVLGQGSMVYKKPF